MPCGMISPGIKRKPENSRPAPTHGKTARNDWRLAHGEIRPVDEISTEK